MSGAQRGSRTTDGKKENGAGSPIARREALKGMGLGVMAAAFELSPPQIERALAAAASLAAEETAGQERQPFTPKFFTPREWRLVRLLSDYVIPRDERSGSASEAKVPEYMDFLLSDKEATEASKVSMRGGLAWINAESHRRYGVAFVSATDAQRRAILDDIAWPAKAPPGMSQGVAFFTRFRDLTASGFFSSQMGWKDLQFMGNVSNPGWDGCPAPALEKLGVSYDLMTTRIPPSQ